MRRHNHQARGAIPVDQFVLRGRRCEAHHIGKDEGIHTMPHPLWVWQRYAPEGYRLSDVEIVHHQF